MDEMNEQDVPARSSKSVLRSVGGAGERQAQARSLLHGLISGTIVGGALALVLAPLKGEEGTGKLWEAVSRAAKGIEEEGTFAGDGGDGAGAVDSRTREVRRQRRVGGASGAVAGCGGGGQGGHSGRRAGGPPALRDQDEASPAAQELGRPRTRRQGLRGPVPLSIGLLPSSGCPCRDPSGTRQACRRFRPSPAPCSCCPSR